MAPARTLLLTALAMLAFAGNSILCRLALTQSATDAASFTSMRLLAGAIVLTSILRWRGGARRPSAGDWRSASALFVYAAGFSWAYVRLPAASGALLLFAAVQITMIGHGLWRGERLRPMQFVGLVAASAGLVVMLSPTVRAPSWQGSLPMVCSGIAWGVYSLRGRGNADPLGVTAGNFRRACLLSLVMSAILGRSAEIDAAGVGYAVASGALASAVGYAVWYTVLPALAVTRAATVQLCVPVLAALGAVALVGEPIGWRLAGTSVVVLGGVALVILGGPARMPAVVQGAAER